MFATFTKCNSHAQEWSVRSVPMVQRYSVAQSVNKLFVVFYRKPFRINFRRDNVTYRIEEMVRDGLYQQATRTRWIKTKSLHAIATVRLCGEFTVAVVCRENDLDKYQNDIENYYVLEMGNGEGDRPGTDCDYRVHNVRGLNACVRTLALRFCGATICIRISEPTHHHTHRARRVHTKHQTQQTVH